MKFRVRTVSYLDHEVEAENHEQAIETVRQYAEVIEVVRARRVVEETVVDGLAAVS